MANVIKIERLNAELQKNISDIITNEIKDPRVHGLISILRVETTADYKHAKVFMSVFEKGKNEKDIFKVISGASAYIRRELSQRLNVRTVPELHFVFDDSIEYSTKIDEILKKINALPKSDEKPTENN